MPLLALFAICVVLNTIPSLVATTAVVTVFALRSGVDDVQAVVVGVAGAATGRLLFAHSIRHGSGRLIHGRLAGNMAYLRAYVGRKRNATRFLALFAMAPVNPALAIFATAGALRLRLTPIVACYAVGRAVVFGWAVWTAGKAAESLERVLRENASPLPLIAGVLIALTPLVLATQIDWQTLIEHRRIRLLPRTRPEP
jgi:hypothetical protein